MSAKPQGAAHEESDRRARELEDVRRAAIEFHARQMVQAVRRFRETGQPDYGMLARAQDNLAEVLEAPRPDPSAAEEMVGLLHEIDIMGDWATLSMGERAIIVRVRDVLAKLRGGPR